MDDSPGIPWCATKSKYSVDHWGYCNCPFGKKTYKYLMICSLHILVKIFNNTKD